MEDVEPSPKTQPVAKPQQAPTLAADVPTPDVSPQSELPPSATQSNNIQDPFIPSDKHFPLQKKFDSIGSNDGIAARRPSVQFVPHVKLDAVRGGGERSASRNPVLREAGARRLSSPPPPDHFTPRVSFDTFDNKDASDFSLTLSRKHKEYVYSKRSRTFLCGTDANEYSDTALEWLIDELVDDGDEIVCLRVVEKDSKEAIKWAGGGTNKEGRERAYQAEANRMLERIQEKNLDDRAINLVLEFSIGKIFETIQLMISIYEPAMLVVGTKGRSLSGFQGLLPGSVSKYCLQHSPVPVIVVRPSSKRDKKKRKRLKDPSRRGYRDILDQSEDVAEGSHLLDQRNRFSVAGTDVLGELAKRDAADEAKMVAEAIGYSTTPTTGGADSSALTRKLSTRSNQSTRSVRSSSFTSNGGSPRPRSPAMRPLKSPEPVEADSLPASEEEESDYEEFAHVPAYVLAHEEALNKARERGIKAAEEEKEAEIERIKKENSKPIGKKKKPAKPEPEPENAGGAGALNLLDDLRAQEKQRGFNKK